MPIAQKSISSDGGAIAFVEIDVDGIAPLHPAAHITYSFPCFVKRAETMLIARTTAPNADIAM